EISLEGSGLSYQPGDALGIWPVQSTALVDQVLDILNLSPDEILTIGNATHSVKEWLGRHRELTQLTKPFLVAHAALAQNDKLTSLLQPEASDEFRTLLATRQLVDILKAYPASWTAQGLIKALRPVTPRMYSSASSQTVVDEEVHLTLANVAY